MSGKPVLLYVDDDAALVRLVQRTLERRGYAVEHVVSGEEGLARVGRGGVDVVALDHYLPTGTGLDFLAELAKTASPPPVVYVTGAAETAVAVAALKAGAADYVLKSVDNEFLELLASAVEQAMEKSRLQRERDRAEADVREARDRVEVLLHEVNHRVANSLALVAGLVAMQAKSATDPAVRAALGEVQGRIVAVGGVHRRLYTSQDVRLVEVSEYLAGLLRDIEATLKEGGHTATVSLDAEAVQVSTEKAVAIGIIVTELVTNAFKYAYPPGQSGAIRVVLRTRDAVVRLRVEDDGIGWQGEGPATGTGVGSRIVSALARSLGSTVQYSAGRGCCVSLEFAV